MIKIERVVVGNLEENCYVLSKNNGCLIVDPGDEMEKINQLVGNKKVLSVLITHYHFDHAGVLDEVVRLYNVPVIDYKSNGDNLIGDFSFEIIKTKGHSKDSVTYYFKDDKIMMTGDFIFKGTVGRCDLEGGNVKEMINSLNMMKKYSKDIKVYPGHGDMTTLKDEFHNNPYMKGMHDE